MTALILVGHGSHISPNTGGLIWRYVDRLRQLGVADEIAACFWKEQPSIHEVLYTVEADDVTIIPVFTAQGYFTQTVIPAELGLNQNNTRTIRYGKTPGEHPGLADILQKRVHDALTTYNLNPDQTTVAIVGHGTRRNKDSRRATRQQVTALQARGMVCQVIDAYLDDEPDIPSIYSRVGMSHVVVVPFFLAAGSHVSIDVPNALGLPIGQIQAKLNGKQVYYTDPIGTDETICQMILDLAYEAGMPQRQTDEPQRVWQGFPRVGQEDLVQQVHEQGFVIIGDVVVTSTMIRPVDQHENAKSLCNPASLRAHIRDNPFRPLASSRDLPADWYVPVLVNEAIPAIVDTVYPSVVAALGQIDSNSLNQTLGRQQGDFRALEALSPVQVQATVDQVCGNCVKHPLWYGSLEGTIPCMEACNMWMSRALRDIS